VTASASGGRAVPLWEESWFVLLFPFFVACSRAGEVLAVGRSLRKALGRSIAGEAFESVFELVRPVGASSFSTLSDPGSLVVLRVGGRLPLRGQAIPLESAVVFVGTPWFSDLREVLEADLSLDDFAAADTAADYIVVLGQLRAQLAESKTLAERLSEQIRRAERLRDEARIERERAEDAVRMRERFLAMMSHELRTPLTTILTTNQLMLLGELPDSQREYALAQQKAGRSLLALINSVLDLAKLREGKFDLVPERFEPRVALEDVLGPMRDGAHARGLVLEWIASAGVADAVRSDPVRFKQVLTNLVGNALKFTSRGGVLVRLSSRPADGDGLCRLVIRVTDTGIGIDEATRAKLFQPFSQGANARDVPVAGTGLGLSICREIAQLMSGAVGASSNAGGGSTFWFEGVFEVDTSQRSLRRTGQYRSLLRATVPKPLPREERPTILVVEDEPINRRLLGAIVESLGYNVEVCSDGHQAVAAISRGGLSAVLMDCNMPVIDGFEATRRVRSLPGPMANTPIIAVTAYALEGDRERCMAAGMDDYLTKPVSRDSVRAALAGWAPTSHEPAAVGDQASGQPSTMQSTASVDPTVLQSLRSFERPNEPSLIAEVLGLFETDVRRRSTELRSAVSANDRAGLKTAAHALRGACGNVGARRLERLARWLDGIDPLDDWVRVRDVADAFEMEIDQTLKLLRAAAEMPHV